MPFIPNFRTFIFADLVRRYLEFKGYAVRHVMNITDVEDKIIRRVRETGKSLRDYTTFYEAEFLKDLEQVYGLTVLGQLGFPLSKKKEEVLPGVATARPAA